MCWKNHSIYKVQYYLWFQESTGGPGMSPHPMEKRGLLYKSYKNVLRKTTWDLFLLLEPEWGCWHEKGRKTFCLFSYIYNVIQGWKFWKTWGLFLYHNGSCFWSPTDSFYLFSTSSTRLSLSETIWRLRLPSHVRQELYTCISGEVQVGKPSIE